MRHAKKLALGAAAGLTTLLAFAMPASAADDTDKYPGGTYKLLLRHTQFAGLDLGDPGTGLGDEFVFSGDLYQNNVLVGHDHGVCTLTQSGPDDSFHQQCVVTFSLPEGQLTLQGVVAVSGPTPSFDLAVTGGTRRFHAAQGYASGVTQNETDTLVTLHLDH